MTHPAHEVNREAMAERLAEFLWANAQGSDWLKACIEIDWYWRQVAKRAKEDHVPSLETRQLTIEKLKHLEAEEAPRNESLKVSEETSSEPSEAPRPHSAEDIAAPRRQVAADKPAVSVSASDDAPARAAAVPGPGGQASLLKFPAYQKHSQTSREAAMQIHPARSASHQRIVNLLKERGALTDEQQQDILGMNPSTQRPRRVELMHAGIVVCVGKGKTKSGRPADLWALAQAVSA